MEGSLTMISTMKIGWRANDGHRTLWVGCNCCNLVWEWCFQSCFGLILEDGPTPTQSVFVRLFVGGSVCFVICSFLCLCVILCLCDNVHNESDMGHRLYTN